MKAWRLGQRVEVSGGNVAFEVLEEGPPVVLIHGTPSWSYIWREVAPALAERFSVYVFDLLGYGDSEPAADNVSAKGAVLGALRKVLLSINYRGESSHSSAAFVRRIRGSVESRMLQ